MQKKEEYTFLAPISGKCEEFVNSSYKPEPNELFFHCSGAYEDMSDEDYQNRIYEGLMRNCNKAISKKIFVIKSLQILWNR